MVGQKRVRPSVPKVTCAFAVLFLIFVRNILLAINAGRSACPSELRMYNSVPRSVSPSSSPAANRSPSPSGSGAIRGQVSSPSLTRTYVPPHPPSSPSSGMTGGDSRIPRTGSGASPSPKYSSPRDRESRLQEKKGMIYGP